MDPSVKLVPDQGEPYSELEKYKRLVSKLNYFTVTCPDINFLVSTFIVSEISIFLDCIFKTNEM